LADASESRRATVPAKPATARLIDPVRQTVEIWEIPDVRQADAARIMAEVEQTFEMISQRTDTLLKTLGSL
jgi:hypothetical protein